MFVASLYRKTNERGPVQTFPVAFRAVATWNAFSQRSFVVSTYLLGAWFPQSAEPVSESV